MLVVLASALSGAAGAQAPEQLSIVVTINPYADLIERVAGDRAVVTTLLPPGASPHAFDPSPSQAAQLAGADLIVMNGGLDTWLNRLIDATAPNTKVLVLMNAIDFEALDGHDHGHDDHSHSHDDEHEDHDHEPADQAAFANPHIWLDPLLAARAVNAIYQALAELDPAHADQYAANAHELEHQLEDLDAQLIQIMADVHGAAFVPFHDAWVYFARRYHLNVVVTLEPFPGREPSPRYVAQAVQAVRATGAKAIFAERQLGTRSAEVVAESAGVGVATLDPLGGAPGPTTYEDLLLHNARIIVATLAD